MGFCLANGRHQFDRGASSSIRFLPFVLNSFLTKQPFQWHRFWDYWFITASQGMCFSFAWKSYSLLHSQSVSVQCVPSSMASMARQTVEWQTSQKVRDHVHSSTICYSYIIWCTFWWDFCMIVVYASLHHCWLFVSFRERLAIRVCSPRWW